MLFSIILIIKLNYNMSRLLKALPVPSIWLVFSSNRMQKKRDISAVRLKHITFSEMKTSLETPTYQTIRWNDFQAIPVL